jgi:hypothetical protein
MIAIMTYTEEAYKAVFEAEETLRSVAEVALAARAYAEVARVVALADGLRALVQREEAPAEEDMRPPAPPSRRTHRARPQPATPRSRAPRGYPRFERDGDKLVKIGWSKKGRKEYEHRAPRAAVLAFADRVGVKTLKDETFAIEELLPVRGAAGEELPSYQVYLALAWLQQAGAIEKRGRDGYVRATEALDGSLFDTLWDQIPERS